ncbi:MAG: FimV/HubP family polar landmark protein [Chromatiales bacterium]
MAHRFVVLLLLLYIPSTAYALGLGDLRKRSQLNERFYATVPIINAKAEELQGLTVKLADVERFRRAGLERPAFLSQLRFEVVQTRDGPDYIKITSTEPIREPFINFLIEVNWSKGRLFREYAALLDPPAYKGRSSLPPARPATARREPPRGAIVRDKSATPPWRPEQRAARLAAGRVGGSYGPTVSGDTLWEIALSVRTDPSLSVQQIMFALLHANPDAFFLDNNINALKRGAVLQLPERGDIARMSQREAMQLVSKHSALWEQYRQRVAASAQPQPAGAVSSSGAAGAPAVAAGPAEDEAQLKLLAAAGGGSPQSLAPGTADKGLSIAQETVASQKQEIVELNSKLTEADEIIKLLRKQIEIKDADLAALQAKAAGASAITATPSDRATPETTTPPVSAGASPETSVGGSGTTPKVTEPSAGATPDAIAPSQPPSQETLLAAPESGPPPDTESSALPESSSSPAIPTEPTEPESEVAAPLPPSTPEAPAPPDGGGLTDNLLGGTLGLIGGVAALVVIVVGAAMALKKRGTPDDVRRPVAEDFEPLGARPASPEDSGTFTMPHAPAGPFTPDGQSAASEVVAESNIEDPLSDLDVYLTYERFGEAERLVNQAIAADPNQPDYKLKLLEVYHASGNKTAFAKSAKELRDATGGQGRLWERATAMWQALSPDQPLLADEPAAASVDVEEFMDIGVAEQPRGGPGDTAAVTITTTAEPSVTADFDLGITKWLDAAPAGTSIDGSAGAEASNAEIIDVTSPSAQDTEATEFIDITAAEGSAESAGDTTVRVAPVTDDFADEMTRPMSPVVVDITSPGETGPEATHELPGERTLSSWLKEPLAKIDAPKRSPMEDTLANFDTRIATVDRDDGIEFDLSDFPFEKIEEVKPVISGQTNLTLDAEPSAPPEKDTDPLDIMDLSAEFGLSPEDTSDLYKTINKAEAEQSGTEDEADMTADVDVKLNLAKAYIELGDAEGARSILEEVVQHGAEDQRQEATQLLQQLG